MPTPMPTPLPPDALLEHADFVRRLAWVLTRDDADADDVAQETLARAVARPPADGDRPRPWLAGVVRNVVSHLRRDRGRRDHRERAVGRPERVVGPDELAARAETIRAVAAAVAALDEPYRAVILLRHYDALPPREIAARLGIPVETVSTRLKRAHAQLRAQLDRREGPGKRTSLAVLVDFVSDAGPVAPSGGAVGAVAAASIVGRMGIAAAVVLAYWGAYGILVRPEVAPNAGNQTSASRPALDPAPDSAAGPSLSPPPVLAANPPPPPRSTTDRESPSAGTAGVSGVSGVCVDADGKPVAGAEVYLVAKTLSGLDELRGPHATSDVQGHFALAAESVAGSWIGAVKAGHLPSHADGDALPDARSVRLVLVPGGEVAVHVETDEPDALLSGNVDVTAIAPDAASWEYPAPNREWRTHAGASLGADGSARVRIGTKGPVRVEAEGNGPIWVSEPAEVRLERPEGEVRFRIVHSCAFQIRVVEAGGNHPFEAPIEWVRLDAATGNVENRGSTTNPDRTGIVDDNLYLRTGTYRLRVMSGGYLPWTSGPLTLRRPGEVMPVTAVLAPDPVNAGGTVALSIPVASEKGKCWYRDANSPPGRGEPNVLMRSRDGPWTSPGGTQLLPSGHMLTTRVEWDDRARSLRIVGVPPGPCDVLVWDRSTWTCGHAELSVPRDGIANATIRLVPGVRVRLGDLTGLVLYVAGLRLRAPGVEDLPAVDYISAGSSRTFEGDYPASSDVVLAPLPFDEVWASFQPAEGARREVRLPVAAPK